MNENPDNLKPWWALLGICLLAFVLFLDVGIVANALPAIQNTFHGAALLVIGLTSLVIGLMQGSSWGWRSESTVVIFIIAILALPAFVLVERRQLHSLINFHLINNRIFVVAALTSAVFGIFLATLLFLNPLYLQNVLSLNASTAGLLLMIISGMVVIIAPVAGWLTHRFGSSVGTMMILFLTILSAGLHFFFVNHLQLALIIPAFMTFGMAWGFLNIAPVLAVTGMVEQKDTGVIMGLLWTFLNVGTSVGPAVMGMIFRSADYFMSGFHRTMMGLIILSVMALTITIVLWHNREF